MISLVSKILLLVKILMQIFCINCDELGDVHTSVAQIIHLVNAETDVVAALHKYVHREESRLEVIKRYISEWNTGNPDAYVNNPLNSYHFLKRIVIQFTEVQKSLSDHVNTNEVLQNLINARLNLHMPVETDLNGAAMAIARLQDVYNLPLNDLINGVVIGKEAIMGLTAEDCFLFGEESYKNLEFKLSERWNKKGIELLESDGPLTLENLEKINKKKYTMNKRKIMQNLVTEITQNSDNTKSLLSLGVPLNYQNAIQKEGKVDTQFRKIENIYKRLCRGEILKTKRLYGGLKCANIKSSTAFYKYLMPFKVELIWPDPILAVYHDVITDKEAEIIRSLAFPKLATSQVHSFVSQSATKSSTRIGKTAWVGKGDNSLVDKILRRIEGMTSLSIITAEDFHVLNYGIGGHFDIHADFFDFYVRNISNTMLQGDRIATVLFYLNDVDAGGSTVFPILKIAIPAKRNSALLWFNLKRNGQGDYRTVHAACPVLLGQKWISNLWLHEFGQEFRWPCTKNPED